jgi:hypothetical protein
VFDAWTRAFHHVIRVCTRGGRACVRVVCVVELEIFERILHIICCMYIFSHCLRIRLRIRTRLSPDRIGNATLTPVAMPEKKVWRARSCLAVPWWIKKSVRCTGTQSGTRDRRQPTALHQPSSPSACAQDLAWSAPPGWQDWRSRETSLRSSERVA